jgi:hypothetical protein
MFVWDDLVEWDAAIEGVYKVSFTAWVNTLVSCLQQDGLRYSFCHFELYFPDYGICYTHTDALLHVGVNVTSCMYYHDFGDRGEWGSTFWGRGLAYIGCCRSYAHVRYRHKVDLSGVVSVSLTFVVSVFPVFGDKHEFTSFGGRGGMCVGGCCWAGICALVSLWPVVDPQCRLGWWGRGH